MFHILVVDDDKNTRRLLKAVLETEEYTISTAENALEVMDKEVIDLVVLDIMMPEMNGYEFTKTLRDINNNLPILMVSAKQLPEDRRKGFLVGTDDYITKPIDEEEMLLRIKALVRRVKIANEHKITIGDVIIDYDSLSVTKNGNTQELPQKEFILDEKGFEVTKENDYYVVSGSWIDAVGGSVSFDDNESLQYFRRALLNHGVIDALVEAGIQEDDTVIIGDLKFDFVY